MTDTNQASEDELENIFSELCVYMYGNDMGSMTEYRIPRFRLQKAKEALQALIRTEKLKLLDRLDKQIEYNKHDMGEMGEFIRTVYAHNAIEAERTKLEAEL